jgi:hypothetical protein
MVAKKKLTKKAAKRTAKKAAKKTAKRTAKKTAKKVTRRAAPIRLARGMEVATRSNPRSHVAMVSYGGGVKIPVRLAPVPGTRDTYSGVYVYPGMKLTGRVTYSGPLEQAAKRLERYIRMDVSSKLAFRDLVGKKRK